MKLHDQKEFLIELKDINDTEKLKFRKYKTYRNEQFELSSFFEKFENYFLME